ncbi:MAG: hypothetical protein ACRCXL_05330 [Dermatophilaceae bacterium]
MAPLVTRPLTAADVMATLRAAASKAEFDTLRRRLTPGELRSIEVYEHDRLDDAEAYLVACAESTGVGRIASFDRTIDRVVTVARVEPGRA